jgi:hypothetical protein
MVTRTAKTQRLARRKLEQGFAGAVTGQPALRQAREAVLQMLRTHWVILKTSGGFGPLRHLKKPHGQR